MMRPQKPNPHAGGRRGSKNAGLDGRAQIIALKSLYGGAREPTLPKNWREWLPKPSAYYSARVPDLGGTSPTGWAQGTCPFHDDRGASLSVHLDSARGHWRCAASCGGGDLLGFHQRLTGLPFKEAVRDLVRGAA